MRWFFGAYASLAFPRAWVVVAAQTAVPTVFWQPENQTSTMAVISTKALSQPCAQSITDCVARLVSNCTIDDVPKYLECACVNRQAGELGCFAEANRQAVTVTPECSEQTSSLTSLYCGAAQYYQLHSYQVMSTTVSQSIETIVSTEERKDPPSNPAPSIDKGATESSSASLSSSAFDSSAQGELGGSAILNPTGGLTNIMSLAATNHPCTSLTLLSVVVVSSVALLQVLSFQGIFM